MKSGFANILKPPEMTSSDAVVSVRRCFPKGTRVGHMGTLDPGAIGVLPIGVGKAARLFDFVIDKDKEYIAEMELGIETDTQDRFGKAVSQRAARVSKVELEEAIAGFLGEIRQVPPAYSAVKKDGKRLYELARSGEDAQVPSRSARIDEIELLHFEGSRALLRIVCGRGTYIRTLLHDIGRTLGCGAHMAFLVRTRAGPFRVEDALPPDRFRALAGKGGMPLVPMDAPLSHLPKLALNEGFAADVHNGRALDAALMPKLAEGGVCRVYLAGAFAGILERNDGLLRWKAMLLEDTI